MALERFSAELNPIIDYNDIAWAEYYKVLCAMELGDSEVESAMEGYVKRFPVSPYRNTVQFMLACYVSDSGDMERAAELLRNSELPIADICSQVGMPDAQYFSRVFKSYFGTPPSTYREQKSNG